MNIQSLHPDSATTLVDTEYFFLGNGNIAVAIQWSRNADATPLGLMLWRPDQFTRKWGTALFHPEYGLERTMLTVIIDGIRYSPRHHELSVEWSEYEGVPVVFASWKAGEFVVVESFNVSPDGHSVTRWICVRGAADRDVQIEAALYANPTFFSTFGSKESVLYAAGYGVLYLSTKQSGSISERFLVVTPEHFNDCDLEAHFVYVAGTSTERVDLNTQFDRERAYWENTSSIAATGDIHQEISQLFFAMKNGLRAAVGTNGRFDASIWQYGMEWGRDAARVAEGLVYTGQFEIARSVLNNILTKLSNDDGMVAEASRFRGGANSELDSNGLVLTALKTYVDWTGDVDFIKEHWQRISAIADYLLRPEFLDEISLLRASRDIWERSSATGIKLGYDVAHQTFAITGLDAAVTLSAYIGEAEKYLLWSETAQKIKNSFLSHPSHSFISNGRIIKRRLLDGSVQSHLQLERTKAGDDFFSRFVPTDMPLAKKGDHKLTPDVSQLFPILFGVVDPTSVEAKNTIAEVAQLWSQQWDGGGLGRYDISGEPDSPGPWSLATLLFAQAAVKCGEGEWVKKSMEWLVARGGSGGSWLEFYGDRPTPPLPPIGILVWSWAEFSTLVVRDLLRARVENNSLVIDPLLEGLTVNIRFRDTMISHIS